MVGGLGVFCHWGWVLVLGWRDSGIKKNDIDWNVTLKTSNTSTQYSKVLNKILLFYNRGKKKLKGWFIFCLEKFFKKLKTVTKLKIVVISTYWWCRSHEWMDIVVLQLCHLVLVANITLSPIPIYSDFLEKRKQITNLIIFLLFNITICVWYFYKRNISFIIRSLS